MADPHKTANHTLALGESARKAFNGMADAVTFSPTPSTAGASNE